MSDGFWQVLEQVKVAEEVGFSHVFSVETCDARSAEAAAETEVDARPVQGGPVESLVSLTNTQSLVTPFGARCFMKPNMYPAMRRIWISSVPSVMR